jgi:hypothetical protein
MLIVILIIIVFALLAVLGGAVEIPAGANHSVDCSETNDTINLTCLYAPQTCSINHTMKANETWNYSEGSCDLDITCEGVPESQLGGVKFPGYIKVEKKENYSMIYWHVDDWLGNPYRDVVWNISAADIVVQERKIDFECPAEIRTNINFETCSEFFDKFMSAQDTNVLSIMALSASSCQKELVKAQAEVMARQQMAQQYENDYIDQVARCDAMKDDLKSCKQDLLGPNGQCERDKSELRSKIAEYERAYVPAYWEWGFIVAVMFLAVIMFFSMFGGRE